MGRDGAAPPRELVSFARPAALDGVEVLRVEDWTRDWTGLRDGYTLTFVRAGHGIADFGASKGRLVGAGGVTLMAPGDVHRGRCVEPSSFDVLFVPPGMVDETARERWGPATVWFPEPHVRRADTMLAAGRLVERMLQPDDALSLDSALASLLDLALREAPGARRELAPRRDLPIVARLRERLHAEYTGPVDLNAAARDLGVSKAHLIRSFTTAVGLPPYEYVTNLRIEQAKLLIAGGWSLGDVAKAAGYYDQSQLNRHFRRIVGVTPGVYAAAVRGEPVRRQRPTSRP